jgi:hypothetical protein
MKSKWVWTILVALVGVAVYAGTVLATPPSGVVTTNIAVGRFDSFDVMSKTALAAATTPVDGKGDKGDDSDRRTNYWKARLSTKGASDLYVLQNTIAPGGTFGWHSHPAALLPSLAAPLQARTISTVAPPKCSDAGSAAVSTAWLPGHQVVSVSVPVPTTANAPPPTWTRWCGPAVVLVRLHGASFRISGGRCWPGSVLFGVFAGLKGSTPAAPAKWFNLEVSDPRHHAGIFRLFEASIQLRGDSFAMPEQISSGTVTIGGSMRDGTFALRLRDATRVTGSWTCGLRRRAQPSAH